jgi:hypothetical protein
MRWVVLGAIGAAVCTLLDHVHVTHGVLFYARPVLWQQGWWVVPMFGTATVGAVAAVEPTRRLLRGAPLPAPSGPQLAGDMIAFVGAYLFTSFGHGQPVALLVLLVAWWLSRVAGRAPAWVVAFCLVSAVVGPLVEATLSAIGNFNYVRPDVLGVALWLPGLYLHVGLVAASVAALVRHAKA